MCYSITFSKYNILSILQFFFFQAFFMLITVGVLISFTLKHIADKYFKNDDLGFTHQGVDYLHAFDIHCNSSVPMYTFSVVIPFFILPIVLNESFLSTMLSNALALTGILYYCYVTLLAYYCNNKNKLILLALPLIKKNKYLTLGLCKEKLFNVY